MDEYLKDLEEYVRWVDELSTELESGISDIRQLLSTLEVYEEVPKAAERYDGWVVVSEGSEALDQVLEQVSRRVFKDFFPKEEVKKDVDPEKIDQIVETLLKDLVRLNLSELVSEEAKTLLRELITDSIRESDTTDELSVNFLRKIRKLTPSDRQRLKTLRDAYVNLSDLKNYGAALQQIVRQIQGVTEPEEILKDARKFKETLNEALPLSGEDRIYLNNLLREISKTERSIENVTTPLFKELSKKAEDVAIRIGPFLAFLATTEKKEMTRQTYKTPWGETVNGEIALLETIAARARDRGLYEVYNKVRDFLDFYNRTLKPVLEAYNNTVQVIIYRDKVHASARRFGQEKVLGFLEETVEQYNEKLDEVIDALDEVLTFLNEVESIESVEYADEGLVLPKAAEKVSQDVFKAFLKSFDLSRDVVFYRVQKGEMHPEEGRRVIEASEDLKELLEKGLHHLPELLDKHSEYVMAALPLAEEIFEKLKTVKEERIQKELTKEQQRDLENAHARLWRKYQELKKIEREKKRLADETIRVFGVAEFGGERFVESIVDVTTHPNIRKITSYFLDKLLELHPEVEELAREAAIELSKFREDVGRSLVVVEEV